MWTTQRRSTPKVTGGQVQKKNRHRQTASYWNELPATAAIDKERAGRGYKHVVSKADVATFIALIPEWDRLSVGLRAVLLAQGERGTAGWYDHAGVIGLCAWDKDLWRSYRVTFFEEHRGVLERIGVPYEREADRFLCKFNEQTARAFLLMHIFLHELGHHCDQMTTHRQIEPGRGERYAEQWALKYEARLWNDYRNNFDI